MTNGSDRSARVSDAAAAWPPAPLWWPTAPLTDGVVALDAMTHEDVPRVVAGASDPEAQRWLPLPAPYTEEAAEQFLTDQEAAAEAGRGLNFAVRRASSRPLCGSVGVSFDGRRGEAEIGYWISPDARGEGLAARSMRVLASWAIPAFDLQRVEMLVQPANVASRRACQRAGATAEGVRRRGLVVQGRGVSDALVYSLTADDLV